MVRKYIILPDKNEGSRLGERIKVTLKNDSEYSLKYILEYYSTKNKCTMQNPNRVALFSIEFLSDGREPWSSG